MDLLRRVERHRVDQVHDHLEFGYRRMCPACEQLVHDFARLRFQSLEVPEDGRTRLRAWRWCHRVVRDELMNPNKVDTLVSI